MDISKITKLRKDLAKDGVAIGFSNPTVWVSSGNYALNDLITSNYSRGIPNKKTIMLWGPSNSGKSLMASLIAKNCQDAGYFVVYIDTEHAMHEDYLKAIGMDLSEEKFLPVNISTIDGDKDDSLTGIMAKFFSMFEKEDKVAYVLDSLTMLETTREQEGFDKGEAVNDMGLFPKKAKQVIKNLNNKISQRDNFFIMTNHAYQNQDIRNGEGTWIPSGGKGIIFIPSISILFTHLKNRENGVVNGIKVRAELFKSRFTPAKGKTFEMIVPFDSGVDPYDGLLDIAVNTNLVKKSGSWYSFIDENNEEIRFQGSKGFTEEIIHKLFDFSSKNEIIEYDEDPVNYNSSDAISNE